MIHTLNRCRELTLTVSPPLQKQDGHRQNEVPLHRFRQLKVVLQIEDLHLHCLLTLPTHRNLHHLYHHLHHLRQVEDLILLANRRTRQTSSLVYLEQLPNGHNIRLWLPKDHLLNPSLGHTLPLQHRHRHHHHLHHCQINPSAQWVVLPHHRLQPLHHRRHRRLHRYLGLHHWYLHRALDSHRHRHRLHLRRVSMNQMGVATDFSVRFKVE